MVNVINAFLHGLEKPLILWLLSRGPRHGYDLIKEFRRLTGRKLKPGTVYPYLHWLQKQGFVASEWVKKSGRNLRCYHLTKKGQRLFLKVHDLFGKLFKEVIIDLLHEPEKKSEKNTHLEA